MSERVPPVRELLMWMAQSGASDLHLSLGAPPVFRRNGALERSPGIVALGEDDLHAVLGELMTDEERVRFETVRELDKGLSVDGAGRFRMNAGFERGAPYFAFRHISETIPRLGDLGLPPVCERLTQLPRGLVLVTGPTGSGKSTTLAAMVDAINERDRRHIITVEDPIEFVHRNKRSVINQREVGTDTASFAEALKHVLRQDPDVILIGEMRDLETMASAITAAETGHLVFATLHTPDAPQSIDRIVDAFPAHQQQQVRLQLAMVIEAVVSQVLLPQAAGDGRVAACEVMLGTPAIRNLIREAKTPQIATAMSTGAGQGMRTLDQALADLLRRGAIARETALAYARNGDEVDRLVSARAA
jgi:twitching motility protein PilT